MEKHIKQLINALALLDTIPCIGKTHMLMAMQQITEVAQALTIAQNTKASKEIKQGGKGSGKEGQHENV